MANLITMQELEEKISINKTALLTENTFDWKGTFMTYMHTGKISSEEFMSYIQKIFPTIINVKEK